MVETRARIFTDLGFELAEAIQEDTLKPMTRRLPFISGLLLHGPVEAQYATMLDLIFRECALGEQALDRLGNNVFGGCQDLAMVRYPGNRTWRSISCTAIIATTLV